MTEIPLRILLVDDESAIAETVIAYAKKENMAVDYLRSGEEWLNAFKKNKYDLVLLDWMLPGISGPEIIKTIRQESNIPILMMSARDDESDIVIGLDFGADDYITKPFGPRELMARIKSLIRRSGNGNGHATEDVTIGNLVFSPAKKEIRKNGETVNLTPNELRIFEVLYENKNCVVSREQLMEKALWYRDFLSDRAIDTHMKNLRSKIEEDPKKPVLITTLREIGFKFNA